MQRVFDLHLYFLQHSQSETLQKHVFAALRQFIKKVNSFSDKNNKIKCESLLTMLHSYDIKKNEYGLID